MYVELGKIRKSDNEKKELNADKHPIARAGRIGLLL